MSKDAPLFPGFDMERAEKDARRLAEALADELAGTLQIAHALVRTERRVNLAGLDRLMGLLCARALDLRQDHGRSLRPRLVALLGDLDALSAALAASRPD